MEIRQKTKEQLQVEECNKVLYEVINTADNLFNGIETVMRLIYQNQMGLTAQDMFDVLGLDGKRIVSLAKTSKKLLYEYDANKFPPIQSPFELKELPEKIEVVVPPAPEPTPEPEPEEEVTP